MTVKKNRSIRRVDVQVSIMATVMVVLSCLSVYLFCYYVAYQDMRDSLEKRTASIHQAIESLLYSDAFDEINAPADMASPLYQERQQQLTLVRQAAAVRYLYTAKRDAGGTFVYGIDGLPLDTADFRKPGDPIEPEIVPALERAMAGETVLPEDIKKTDWGKIFIAYLPVHDGERVVGVVGVEFDAEHHYNTYLAMRWATPFIVLVACALSALLAVTQFRRVSNPTYLDLSNTDYLTQLKNRNAFELDMNNLNARRNHDISAILTMDLNDLKVVNDRLGHDCGDFYLKIAADSIREVCEDRVAAYRVGGDEFVVLYQNTTAAQLEQLKAQLNAALIQKKPTDWPVGMTFSTGYALFDGERDGDIHGTYRHADRAMYVEKQRYHQVSRA